MRARPDLADRVGDALAGDVGRRAVHRLEQRRELALGIDVAPTARCRSCRCRPGRGRTGCRRTGWSRRPRRTSPGCARSARSGCRCGTGRRVMSGIALRHRVEALVPVRHGDRDAVRLGGRGQVLLRRACCASSKANFRMRSTPLRVNTVSWITISRSVPSNMRPPTERVLALGVLAHDEEVDVARLAVGERRAARPASAAPAAGSRTGRSRGGTGSASPTARRGRAPSGPADGAEEDRVVAADLRPSSRPASSGRACA